MLEPDLFTEGNLGLHYIEQLVLTTGKLTEPWNLEGYSQASLHGGSGVIKDQDQDNIEVV